MIKACKPACPVVFDDDRGRRVGRGAPGRPGEGEDTAEKKESQDLFHDRRWTSTGITLPYTANFFEVSPIQRTGARALTNVPSLYSRNASSRSSRVFITIGPAQAISS